LHRLHKVFFSFFFDNVGDSLFIKRWKGKFRGTSG
jgi:hypothetical protein